MILLVIAYIIGVIVISTMLLKSIVDVTDRSEVMKDSMMGVGVALVWPILGLWLLWEIVDICLMNYRDKKWKRIS